MASARSGTLYQITCIRDAETQAAEGRDFRGIDAAACYQHVEGLSHSSGSGEVLELESHFGALLRQAAFFEGVGKLRLLADTHQKLRLRDETFGAQSGLFGGCGKSREVYVRGQILLSRSLISVGAG